MQTNQSLLRVANRSCLKVAFLLFASLAGAALADDQPENIMVENLTFVRPEGWKWKASPEESKVAAHFVVSTNDAKLPAQVTFVSSVMSGESAKEYWKGRFPDANQPSDSHSEKVHDKEVYFFHLQGTYQVNGKVIHRDAKMVGAIIPTGLKKSVHVRILGPKSEVDEALGKFKNMIADALRKE